MRMEITWREGALGRAILTLFLALLLVGCPSAHVPEAEMISLPPASQDGRTGTQRLLFVHLYPQGGSPSGSLIPSNVLADMDSFFAAQSYGRLRVAGEITRPMELPGTIQDYTLIGANGREASKERFLRLLEDTVTLVQDQFPLDAYRGLVLCLDMEPQQYGRLGIALIPGGASFTPLAVGEGLTVNGALVGTSRYFSDLGFLAHDLNHLFGGVAGRARRAQCLWNFAAMKDLRAAVRSRDRQALQRVLADINQFIGSWGLMGRTELPGPPLSGFTAYTRLRMGWIPNDRIGLASAGESRIWSLGPLENPRSEILVIRAPLGNGQTLLVENRQPLGFDQNLPHHGVLVTMADESVREGKGPLRVVKASANQDALTIGQSGPRSLVLADKDLAVVLLSQDQGSYRVAMVRDLKAMTPERLAAIPGLRAGEAAILQQGLGSR